MAAYDVASNIHQSLIIGVNQLMLDTPLDAEQQELTDLIKTSADSLLSVINDILDLARVESGKLGEAVQVDEPIKSQLKAPGTKRLKL